MIGRAGVLPAVVGVVLVLASGCSTESPPATSPDVTDESAPPAAAAGDEVTSKDFCGLVSAEQLSGVAFPVTVGEPLAVGTARVCRFPASDGAGGPVPDSVMIGALPLGAATGAGEPVTVEGMRGSRVLTKTECSLLLEAKGGAIQILVARAGKGPQQCAIAEKVAAVVVDRL